MSIFFVLCAFSLTAEMNSSSISESQVIQSKPASESIQGQPVSGSAVLRTVMQINAGTSADFVVNTIRSAEKIVDGMEALKGKPLKDREAQLRKLITSSLDIPRLGERAMSAYWNKLGKTAKGKKQREKYMSLFRQLLEENYMEQARKYIGGKYTIVIHTEVPSKEGLVTLNGRIKKKDVDVIVEWDLVKEAALWKIVDVRLDSTSLEATYRSSFNRIIKKRGGLEVGFPELLQTMQKRLAELKNGKATKL